ncbi:hypothetical protein A2U01_0075671, partial [Trifolium medium]|nr:hypothetical protein [Trifolium medium]
QRRTSGAGMAAHGSGDRFSGSYTAVGGASAAGGGARKR